MMMMIPKTLITTTTITATTTMVATSSKPENATDPEMPTDNCSDALKVSLQYMKQKIKEIINVSISRG